MNKTKQLMAAITASLFAGAPIASHGTPITLYQQQTKQPDETKNNDPTLEKDSQAILEWLKSQSSGQTMDEIAKQFTKMTHTQLEQALENLRQNDDIRRSGAGSKDDDYKYYVPKSSEG